MNLTILLQAAQGAATEGAKQGSALGSFLPLLLIFVVIWLFMIRPQNKKQKEIEKARQALKTGDKIITNGGIYGKIRDVKDDSFIVEVSENVRIRVEKSAVFAAPEAQAAAPKKEEKKKEEAK